MIFSPVTESIFPALLSTSIYGLTVQADIRYCHIGSFLSIRTALQIEQKLPYRSHG